VGQRPSVINVAIAGPDNNVLHETVRRAVAAGIPIVAAAGNGGHAAPPRYPAAYGEVIAVTAVDRYRNVFEGANEGNYITLAAPGVQIWVADAEGRGRFADGTSFATPFVSAEVAMIRSGQPAASPGTIIDTLRHRTIRVGAAGQDAVYGAGLLQSQGCASMPAAGAVGGSLKD
jgi:subtilisin family serine protease